MSKNGRKKPDPRDIEVGRRVRFYRMKGKFSQEQVGDALDLTFQQIQKYEKGTNRIAPSRLEAMAKLFKVPVSVFFSSMDDKKTDAGEAIQFAQNRTTLLLLQALDATKNPKLAGALLAVVEAVNNGR